jgi:TM2 domain-containing membrane protein YozV
MDSSTIDMFILNKGKFFPDSSLMLIRDRLAKYDDSFLSRLLSASFKNPTTGFLYSIGLGVYGIDRFYVGHVFSGILKLILTLAFFVTYVFIVFDDDSNPILAISFFILAIGVVVWYITDIFKISKEIKEYNFTYLLTILN